jgi:predicted ATPase/class 3 adenylate cyclase
MPPEGGAKVKTSASAGLPTGAVTFLFSDIEGSTQRWEAHPEAMKAAVERHEQLVSGAIARHGGHVFKLMGDAFCAAFHSAPDAIAAASDAQRALAEEDFSGVDGLRVRMGLHTGIAEERNADYFGPSVNRVARLMSLGHGGQVLLSGHTQELAHGQLPPDVALIDLRTHRLKDLTDPEHVWQLTIAGLAAEFPPLRSLDARPNNLPVQLTTLVGRERDVEDVKSLSGQHRLLTLFGAGGVGKTRLALQVGADLLDRYPDGVWFADLAPISDPELAASVVASAMGIPQRGSEPLGDAIPQWLKRKQLLLILDNCEHLVEAAAGLVVGILSAALQVRILTTSRQALGIGGEFIHRLPSLALPETTVGLTAQNALDYGAIALFVERAAASDARFALTDSTALIVAEICRRLDGIPLAIELAAARVKVLSISNLAQRLNDRFKILTGGSRTALPRQKTLGALIDWSYDLLKPKEQTLFKRIGIFAGGFGLDAATAVCADDDLHADDVLDLLSSLADKSLVVADTTGERERYRLLESTRAYALDQLATEPYRERLARKHAEYFRIQTQAVDESRGFGSTTAWLASVEVELDNYRAALEWTLTNGHDVALGGAMAGALQWLWSDVGLAVEGRYWIGRAQAGLDESAHPQVAGRLWHALAGLSSGKRRHDYAQRALALYQSVGDGHEAAWCLQTLAYAFFQMGRLDESSEAAAGALTALRGFGEERGVANCLNILGSIAMTRGELAEGRSLYAQALAAFKAVGSETGTASILLGLADLQFADGQFAQAVSLAAEALEIFARGKNATHLAGCYINIAVYRAAVEDLDGAREASREALRLARQVLDAVLIAIALQHLALIAALRGQVRSGAYLLGYVDARYRDLVFEREPTEIWGYDKLMAALREHLSDTEIEKLAAEGAAWSEDQAIEEALKV